MEKSEHKIISIKTYFIILVVLIAFTLISVAVTFFDWENLSVIVALGLASIKSILVFSFFMHLWYDKKMYALMVIGVLLVMTLVLIITFLDYGY